MFCQIITKKKYFILILTFECSCDKEKSERKSFPIQYKYIHKLGAEKKKKSC
jgi:hypothetical protein